MALKTATEWAELYESAITALVGGGVSSYTIQGRSFTKNDLGILTDLHKYWSARATEESSGFTSTADMRGYD